MVNMLKPSENITAKKDSNVFLSTILELKNF